MCYTNILTNIQQDRAIRFASHSEPYATLEWQWNGNYGNNSGKKNKHYKLIAKCRAIPIVRVSSFSHFEICYELIVMALIRPRYLAVCFLRLHLWTKLANNEQ